MVTLVTGGSASGKSAYAEGLVLESPARPRVYAAAMEPFGEEARRRIERHRQLRAGKGFAARQTNLMVRITINMVPVSGLEPELYY